MPLQFLYVAVLFTAFSITAFISISTWTNSGAPGSRLFAGMTAAMAAYVLTSGLMSLAGSPHKALFWVNPHYLSLTLLVAFFLCFTLKYTGLERLLKKPVYVVIFSVPVVTQIVIETNGLHRLFITDISFSPDGMLMGLESIGYGPFFLFHSVYSYGVVLIGLGLMIRKSVRTFRLYRMQSVMFLLGCVPPLLASLNDSRLFNLSFELPLVPLGFALMGMAFAVGISRHKFLKVVPIARDVLVENMSDGLIVLDARSNVVDVNPACRTLLALGETDLVGKSAASVLGERTELMSAVLGRIPPETEISMKTADGERYFDLRASPLPGRGKKPGGKMIVLRDITARKEAENKLKDSLLEVNMLQDRLYRQATRDSQTDLYNRHYLNEVLPRETARAIREKATIAFVLLDIDDFKTINDIYGHAAGDAVIRHVASLLLELTRSNDLAFRYGGDEFLVLMPSAGADAAIQAAQRWKRSLNGSRAVFEGSEIPVSLSIGISVFPHHGDNADELLSAADAAMYRGKTSGKDGIVLYG